MSIFCFARRLTSRHDRRRARILALIDGYWPSGICRFCGCSDFNACREKNGRNCRWANPERTLCDSTSCLRQLGILIRRHM
ncbi:MULTISPECIES: hypothetical protein [Acidobacterium]|uniref:hypothetical protein n=1 Tax=Acidobacterium TaxID=33973 RepID=UPI0002F8F5B5|nr:MULTISPECIES: hypothetical protein [Acidobacterium]HCT62081.1 hypothetical protein [Acidobacterium sp.]